MFELIPLLLQLAGAFGPTLGGMIAGKKGGDVIKTVTEVAGKVFGSTDPNAIAQAVKDNPALAQYYIEKVKAETEQYKDTLADVQSARAQTIQLAQANSVIAWGAPVVSIVIVVSFIALLTIWIFHPPTDSPSFALLVGALSAGFGAVWQYWLGSSAGSEKKDAILGSALFTAQSKK